MHLLRQNKQTNNRIQISSGKLRRALYQSVAGLPGFIRAVSSSFTFCPCKVGFSLTLLSQTDCGFLGFTQPMRLFLSQNSSGPHQQSNLALILGTNAHQTEFKKKKNSKDKSSAEYKLGLNDVEKNINDIASVI